MDMLLQVRMVLTGMNYLVPSPRTRAHLASIFEVSRNFDLVLNHSQRTTDSSFRVEFKLSAGSAFQVDNIRAVYTSPLLNLSTR